MASWGALLLGNGLSINVWPRFGYDSLYARALKGSPHGGLEADDDALFAALGDTTNFERVLGELLAAIRMADACGQDPDPYIERYESIQAALGAAVRAVHVQHAQVPEETLATIRRTMLGYEMVFTTSYDLIAYWSMAFGEQGFSDVRDYFWAGGATFDPADTEVWGPVTPVAFLHGALHLVVADDGTTRKLRCGGATLLEQFGRPSGGDQSERPLLVTEGTSSDKLQAIEANAYLAFALQALRECRAPLVIFGHSLSAQNRHLLDAIALHEERPVAVSMMPGNRKDLRRRQLELQAELDIGLYFFDATTHPLGDPALQAPRRLVRWV